MALFGYWHNKSLSNNTVKAEVAFFEVRQQKIQIEEGCGNPERIETF